jgi:hypothetical protein
MKLVKISNIKIGKISYSAILPILILLFLPNNLVYKNSFICTSVVKLYGIP